MSKNVDTPVKIAIEDVVIAFKVTSINADTYRCNVTVKLMYDTEGINDKSANFRDVQISGLLRYNLLNNTEHYGMNVWYSSGLFDEDTKKNPFQLIKYTDANGNNVLHLACVFERSNLKLESEDMFGTKLVQTVHRYHSKKHYRRYRDYSKKD